MEDGDTEKPSDMEVVDDSTLQPQHSTVFDKDKNVNSPPHQLPNNPKSPTQVQQDQVMVDQADDNKNTNDSSLSHVPETPSHQELVTPKPKEKNVREMKNVLNDTEMTEYDDSGTCSDQEAFMKELEKFYREKKSLKFKPPKFYGEPLNCLKLWRAVMRLGGYDVVTASKLWRQVGESFHPPKTCTTVSWTFRIFYEKALLEYEKFKREIGELQLPVGSLPQSSSVEKELVQFVAFNPASGETSSFVNWWPLFSTSPTTFLTRLIDQQSPSTEKISSVPPISSEKRQNIVKTPTAALPKGESPQLIIDLDALKDAPEQSSIPSRKRTRISGVTTTSHPPVDSSSQQVPSAKKSKGPLASDLNQSPLSTRPPSVRTKKNTTATISVNKSAAIPIVQTPATDLQTQTTAPLSSINISEDLLTQYFISPIPQSITAPGSSPTNQHLSFVEDQLSKDIPRDQKVVTDLRLALLKLVKAADTDEAQRSIFNQMAIQVGDVSFNYRFYKERCDTALKDLSRLKELEDKKSEFQSTYQIVETERKADLAEKTTMDNRLAELIKERERIDKEIADIRPKLETINHKLGISAETKVHLYHQSTSLDPEITQLLQQKEALEEDLSIGKRGLSSAKEAWKNLQDLLAIAKNSASTSAGQITTQSAEEMAIAPEPAAAATENPSADELTPEIPTAAEFITDKSALVDPIVPKPAQPSDQPTKPATETAISSAVVTSEQTINQAGANSGHFKRKKTRSQTLVGTLQ